MYLRQLVGFLFALAIFWSPICSRSGWADSVFALGENFSEELVLKDLPISTAISFASPTRAYLAIKIGQILTVDKGIVMETPFIDLSDIVNKHTDRGLLGLAVDPDFPERPYLYISYVYDPPGFQKDSPDPRVIRVARLTADVNTDFTTAVPNSLKVLIGANGIPAHIAPPVPEGDDNVPERASCMTGLTMEGEPIEDCIGCDALSHTAGTLVFGRSRELFISIGDGADYNGPTRVGLRTQNLDSLSGRVLRVNPDTGEGIGGNPWYNSSEPSSNRSRTWSYGLRNPFRITLDPSDDEPFVGDVGTSYYEEINTGKGRNFGWPCYEGGFLDRSQQEGAATASIEQVGYRRYDRTVEFCNAMYANGQGYVKKPLFNYRHPYDETGKDLGASITGLSFYSGETYPSRYRGALFFADYAQRWIRYITFDPAGNPVPHDFATEVGTGLGAVELLQGPDENIYGVYIDLETRTSQVRRFLPVNGGNLPPTIKATVEPKVGQSPLTVTGFSSASFDPNGSSLDFRWDLNDGRILNAADVSFTYEQPGLYEVKLTVTERTEERLSATETFTIRVGETQVQANIVQPKNGAFFEIGQLVKLEAADVTERYPNAEFDWNILQVHNEHLHLVSELAGRVGNFRPTEHTDNTSYRVCLRMRASEGNEDNECVDLKARSAEYLLQSRPSGAIISYIDEESERATPYVIHPVVGSQQTIKAQATYNGRSFLGWSDGILNLSRRIVVEAGKYSLAAVYRNLRPRARFKKLGANTRKRVIKLDAASSLDPEGADLSYRWLFSDGTRLKGRSIKKRFKSSGRYSVTLTVRDPLGATNRLRKTVVVRNHSIRVTNRIFDR